jgi:hypothetical protein
MKKIVIVIIAILLLAFFISWFLGLFSSVRISEKPMGPYYIVMVERKGSYNETPQIIDSLREALQKDGFVVHKGFGIYYDDPREIPDENCHSIVGNILEDIDTNRITELLRHDYRIEKIGRTPSMVVEFPYRSKMSIITGNKKVYPEIKEYLKKKNYKMVPGFEIYEEDKITYIFEIKKQTQK